MNLEYPNKVDPGDFRVRQSLTLSRTGRLSSEAGGEKKPKNVTELRFGAGSIVRNALPSAQKNVQMHRKLCIAGPGSKAPPPLLHHLYFPKLVLNPKK